MAPESSHAAAGADAAAPRRLPRRDLYLLPALSLLTVIVLLTSSELMARWLWADQEDEVCRVEDPLTGLPRFSANCRSRVKVPEGPWVNNAYNDCGYRTRESCAAKPRGAVRIAVLGPSFSYGYMTPYEEAYTTIAGATLSARCARPVEFQNLGFPNYTLVDVYHRMDEALALEPDVILLAINSVDVRKEISAETMDRRNDPAGAPRRHEPPVEGGWLKKMVITPLRESRAFYMAQHFLYEDPDTYLNLYLLYGDSAGYLRTAPSPAWQRRLANLDVILGDMSQKARAAGVPLLVLLGPQPSQVALVNTRPREGFDPYAFSRRVAAIAAKYGITVIDPLPAMAGRPNPMALFYVVDGHFGRRGQQIIADELDGRLLSGGFPVFAGCRGR